MYFTVKQQLKHLSKEEYLILKDLCHTAKNLYNQGLYQVRQHYFQEKKYLNYQENNQLLKGSEHYKRLNSNMAQQILKEVDGVWKSFFALIRQAKQGKYDFRAIQMPRYLPKDGCYPLIVGFIRLNGNLFVLPYSRSYQKEHPPLMVRIPPLLADKKIKEIRILPKYRARFFEVHYTYEEQAVQRDTDKNHVLAIDLGISNLAACVTSKGKSFLIDGKRLKSINQWYNKRNAHLQRIKDKQKQKGYTHQQVALVAKRNRLVNDYLNKTCRKIIHYCLKYRIGTLVIGYNENLQKGSNLGKRNNQNFVNIPIGMIKEKLEYRCERYGMTLVQQEESYTSKASFWDQDELPTYDPSNSKTYTFRGARVKRGLYRTSSGMLMNADIHGALNILRKSNVVALTGLYTRGEVDTPVRIRIA
ncbi:transposase [Shimazuella sp. AN120528]|uniref:RNA-guided endonuclease InsQ/TnpB family protein n=1 Tax=Shimazuella soli TaxID=1892854 RepID=UPI001F0F1C93|nr:transposase [Shimazuella soli]MCH5585935.1 transposase [Shimazuella soli]